MIGLHRVSVRNARNTYIFELKRNITILKGNSGSGKTTLFDMIRDYNRDGRKSGVNLSCDVPVVALDSFDWERRLFEITNSIIVVDEDSSFIRSKDFAKAVQGNSNYFLLITRNYLSQIPYSVEEIYEISGGKNKRFKPVYKAKDLIYDRPNASRLPFKPDVIITEDSNSGYKFFSKMVSGTAISCVSSEGKSQIYNKLKEYPTEKIAVIADGAAFGSEIHALVEKQKLDPHRLALYLPESFEWLLLSSGIVCDPEIEELTNPQDYVDSEIHDSWEQFFTQLLIDLSSETSYMRYEKNSLKEFYLRDKVVKQIENSIKDFVFIVKKNKNSAKSSPIYLRLLFCADLKESVHKSSKTTLVVRLRQK